MFNFSTGLIPKCKNPFNVVLLKNLPKLELFLTVKLHVTYLKSFGAQRLLKAQQLFFPQSVSFLHL